MKPSENGPLRIAMLGHKRVPSREGGIEVVVGELSRRMAALGHRVTLFNRSGSHVGGAEFATADRTLHEYEGVEIRWAPAIDKRGLAALTGAMSASVMALPGGFDIVHYHAEGPSIMCWLPKLFGKKVVVTVHGLDHRRGKWGKIAKTVILRGERNAARWADAVIVLSEDVRRYFRETYGRETALIPNGTAPAERRAARLITEKYGLAENSYLLFLGRLVPEKGLDCLIEAFRRTGIEKKLVIAGSGSDSGGYVQRLHTLAAGDGRILFTGFVQGETLEELYSNAYLYLLPSRLEGMPLSLLEAMSYGNCCVTSDIPECTDVTGDAAFSFPMDDTRALAALLERLCAEPETVERYKAGAAGYICSRYSWDAVTEQTLKLYRRVLAGEKIGRWSGEVSV